MIVQEILEEDKSLIRTYSDKNKMIRKIGTNEIYSEAIDPISMNRKYEETDQDISQMDDMVEEMVEEMVDDNH